MNDRYIYFIHNKDRDFIKIGISIDIKKRLVNLKRAERTNNIDILLLLRGFPSNTEYKLHNMFADLKVRDEWFRADNRLLDFINRARQDGDIIDFGKAMRLFCEIEQSVDTIYENTDYKKLKEHYTKNPKDYLSIDEINKLLHVAKIYGFGYDEIFFIYHTGVLVNEIIKIKKEDFDLNSNLLRITAYGAKDRDIPIDEELKNYISERINVMKPGELLFERHTGSIQRNIRILANMAEIGRDVSPITIRFTFGNQLVKRVSPKEAQRIMGYTNLNSISDLFD